MKQTVPKMTHTPHELTEAFPEHVDAIHRLKMENVHFAKLADTYHDLTREIPRAETNIEPMDDFHVVELRKKRLSLLDQIHAMLTHGPAT